MTNDAPEVMTVDEVAAYLRIHRTTLYRFCRAGTFPFFKVGSDYRFKREAVDAWMAKQQEQQEASVPSVPHACYEWHCGDINTTKGEDGMWRCASHR